MCLEGGCGMGGADHGSSGSQTVQSGELRAISQKFAEGLARIREVTDTDGACPAWAKALYMSAAACVKGHNAMMQRELGRAVAGGLTYDHARGASIALLISRGEAVYDRFARTVDAAYGRELDGGVAAESIAGDATVDDARAYFVRYFGEVPHYIETMASRAPRALEGYYLMREASLEENPLPWKHVELLLMTVNAAELNDWFVSIHALGARNAGATEGEIVESIVCAIPVAGVASWLPGAQGISPKVES
jgi:alkylhydroperoxidase/carboxymuconolactone decarboxylase family protein YurZ